MGAEQRHIHIVPEIQCSREHWFVAAFFAAASLRWWGFSFVRSILAVPVTVVDDIHVDRASIGIIAIKPTVVVIGEVSISIGINSVIHVLWFITAVGTIFPTVIDPTEINLITIATDKGRTIATLSTTSSSIDVIPNKYLIARTVIVL